MAHAFVPVKRDQALLLPPDLREWLPPSHLAWFVLDAVDQLDLGEFYAHYRTGAQGRCAYDPKMMVALLLYAYATGIRSSRDIERHLLEDVAFRVIAANRSVDHATICRFRRAHEAALSALFVQVVGLCVRAEMVKTTIVAIDGTKIAANASGGKNLTEEQLKNLAAKVFEEAEAIDAEEDRLYGDRRGDEIPEHLIDRAARIEWLREQLAERQPPSRGGEKRINSTDPDSAVMKTPTGYLQGFNAQLAVSEDHVIVAADLTSEAADVGQLKPLVEQTEQNLEAAGAEPVQSIVADAGYLSRDNLALETYAELLIAPTSSERLDEAIENRRAVGESDAPSRWSPPRHDDARRKEVMEAYISKHITASEAASALSAPLASIYIWGWHLRKFGRLPRVLVRRPPKGASAQDIMLERLADPRARSTHKRRAKLVEPVIGQLKELRRLRRFLHRGLSACRCELRMAATAHNLRRAWGNRIAGNPFSISLLPV
jgi:transposase